MEPVQPLTNFRRIFRPLNLILIHQGLWALILLAADGPRVTDPGQLPWDWWGVRAGSAALAAVIALLYLYRLPPMTHPLNRILPGGGPASARTQVAFGILALAVMFTGARLLLESPTDYAAKVVIFGAIDAFAYQIIAFGIAYATFQTSGWGLAAAIASFAISWGFRDLILNIIGDSQAAVVLALIGGAVTGALVAGVLIGLRHWPGGFWTAWAAQYIVITLIAGFS